MIHVQIIRKQNTAVIIYGTNNIINASIKWKSSVLKWILVEQQTLWYKKKVPGYFKREGQYWRINGSSRDIAIDTAGMKTVIVLYGDQWPCDTGTSGDSGVGEPPELSVACWNLTWRPTIPKDYIIRTLVWDQQDIQGGFLVCGLGPWQLVHHLLRGAYEFCRWISMPDDR
jgi:hypothetical protein